MAVPWPWLAVAAFIALIHVAWGLSGDSFVLHGGLADGDSYSRLVRVTRLFDTGEWFDSRLPRANAPFGDTLHWTRPFDVVLLALAALLKPALGFTQALYWAGAAVSPLLHVVSAVALIWATRPFLGLAGACAAGALTAAQFGFMGLATVGHADHHLLFVLITVVALGFMVRSLMAPDGGRRDALAAGLFLALGIWVGTEALIFLALSLLVAALPWLAGEEGAVRRNISLSLGLLVGLALALLVERGPAAYLEVEYDRVSILHLTMAALVVAFWCAVCRWRTNFASRLVAGVAGAAAIVAVIWLLYPKVFLGPMADVDPALLPLLDRISEYRPIEDVPRFLVFVGGALFAVPYAVWRIGREWHSPRRWVWVLIGAAVFLYLTFAINWIRWSLYAGLFMTVPLAHLVGRVDDIVSSRFAAASARAFVKVSAILFLVVGPSAAGAAALYLTSDASALEKHGDREICRMREMSRFLGAPRWAERSRTILSSANFGAELMYRTGHKVVATLHHRNGAGILDSRRILGGTDETEILRLLRERGIDLILLCPGSGADSYFLESEDRRVLYRRLEEGDTPAWLREVELPQGLKGRLRLFEVAAPP